MWGVPHPPRPSIYRVHGHPSAAIAAARVSGPVVAAAIAAAVAAAVAASCPDYKTIHVHMLPTLHMFHVEHAERG